MALMVDIRKQWKDFRLDIRFCTDPASPETRGDPAEPPAVALFGPSGAGKSLALACIAGHIQPDEGCIVLNGRTLYDSRTGIHLPPRSRQIGCLFQQPCLFPEMSVADNIGFGLMNQTKAVRRSMVMTWLQRIGLEKYATHRPHMLSGGQQQRVALARALAPAPQALLLDEPFSALDAALRDTMLAHVRNALGTYAGDYLFVTHRVEEAYRLCPRILLIDHGRITEDTDRHTLFSAPPSPEAARAIGCPNALPCRIDAEGRPFVAGWDHALALPDGVRFPVETTHVGIWPEDVEMGEVTPGMANILPCRHVPDHRIDTPRTVRLRFTPAGASTSSTACIEAELDRRTAERMLAQPGPFALHLPPHKLFAMRPARQARTHDSGR